MARKKILVYTDSRGQHKPANSTHEIFGERLRSEFPDIDVELVLCPMKWTTILDFFDYAKKHDLSVYDWVVVYLGIVDWSPRPANDAMGLVYNNVNEVNTDRLVKETRDYSQKTVNNKKPLFDALFGEQAMMDHLSRPTNVEFMGQPTVSMYSLEMAERAVLPRLLGFDKLIFINSNRFLSYWNGDHKKGRPANINDTFAYSELFSRAWPQERLVDLRGWSDNEIQHYTCDNLHLTKAGSDFIFERLVQIMKLSPRQQSPRSPMETIVAGMEKDPAKLITFKPIERYDAEKKAALLTRVGASKHLATLIIGLRIKDENDDRLSNLSFLLTWIDRHYGDMFDVLLVEQDSEQRYKPERYQLEPYVRYEFIYNPYDYNRGWGYNVAVRHFCHDARVVALMDVDILTGSNFVDEVRDCLLGKYDVISPYQNVYDTDAGEALSVMASMAFDGLKDTSKIKRATSITGGIVIVNREFYLDVHGFEQYMGYACEDRAFDVTVMNLCDPQKVRIAPYAYIHLYHPTDQAARKNFKDIYQHLTQNYGCVYDPSVPPTGFIHAGCKHADKQTTLELARDRGRSFGDKNLYSKGGSVMINGILQSSETNAEDVKARKVLLPEDFRGLDDYEQREIYKAPPPDIGELAQFYNAFLGERCFILGNGPSLNRHDLSHLANEYTFGVNGIFYKTDECGYAPTFYVVEDSSVMKENIERIKAYKEPVYKFFPTNYASLHPKTPNTYFFKMNRGFYEKSSPNFAVPRFSTDATKQLYCGQSVTHINLQLAYYMGFTEVYLIGMDFSYVIPESHKRTGDVLLSDTNDDNHFNPNYFGKGKTWKDPKLDRVENNYRLSKLVYESVGRKIYNASVGGKLEVFDRVDYNTLFPSARKAKPLVIVAPTAKAPQAPAKPAAAAAPPKPQPAAVVPTAPRTAAPVPAPAAQRPAAKPAAPSQALDLPLYTRTALYLQGNSPVLFQLGQFGMWGLRKLKRNPLVSLASIFVLVAVVATPLVWAVAAPHALWIWALVAGIVLSTALVAAIGFLGRKLVNFLEREQQARQSLRNSVLQRIAAVEKVATRADERSRQVAARSDEAAQKYQEVLKQSSVTLEELRDHAREAYASAAELKAFREETAAAVGALPRAIDTQNKQLEELQKTNISVDVVAALRAVGSIVMGGTAAHPQTPDAHGHDLLLAVMAETEKRAPGWLAGKTLVEIGTTRERVYLNQGSTEKLAVFTAIAGMTFVTVDMDPDNTNRVQGVLRHINPQAKAVAQKGEDYLAAATHPIDIVYLDAFDFNHDKHSEHRRAKYREILATDIEDEACWAMHFKCAESLATKVSPGGIVVFDDTWTDDAGGYAGKGKTAVPFLLENGFTIIARSKQAIALKKA